MTDYVIHAKLKNNNVLRRILARWKNVNQFCEDCGLEPSVVGALVNMKLSAVSSDGCWRLPVIKIADALSCEPEDLFVEEQKTVRLASNEAYIEMTRQQVLSMANPLDAIEGDELKRLLFDNSALRPNESKVLRLRYESDMTLDEVADAFGVTRERIRQIETKALRKLRSPQVVADINAAGYESGMA